MDQSSLRRVISGEDGSLRASVLRGLLCFFSYIYSGLVRTRNLLYDWGILKTGKCGGFVISIGNITAGGTGKTPLVIWMYQTLKFKGAKCSIITRGYKSESSRDKLKDEPAMLEENCPAAEVIVNPDRLSAAIQAVNDFDAEAIILDDGFQHRRLARDIDIVCIDSSCPFGYRKILPAGFLREPAGSLKRADAVVLTRVDQAEQEKLDEIIGKVKNLNPKAVLASTRHKACRIQTAGGKELGLDELKNKKVYAFCGIGNPQAFFYTLTQSGAVVAGKRAYNDHYRYGSEDLKTIARESEKSKADLIITTEKDYIKLPEDRLKDDIEIYVLKTEIDFVQGKESLEDLISNRLLQKNVEFGTDYK